MNELRAKRSSRLIRGSAFAYLGVAVVFLVAAGWAFFTVHWWIPVLTASGAAITAGGLKLDLRNNSAKGLLLIGVAMAIFGIAAAFRVPLDKSFLGSTFLGMVICVGDLAYEAQRILRGRRKVSKPVSVTGSQTFPKRHSPSVRSEEIKFETVAMPANEQVSAGLKKDLETIGASETDDPRVIREKMLKYF